MHAHKHTHINTHTQLTEKKNTRQFKTLDSTLQTIDAVGLAVQL